MIPISIDKNKKSITYAGIQKGKLIIKGNQNYNVDKVNRNTQDTKRFRKHLRPKRHRRKETPIRTICEIR